MQPKHRTVWILLLGFLAALAVATLPGCGSEDSPNIPSPAEPAPLVADGGDDGDDGAAPDQPQLTLADPQPATITAGSTGATVTATLVDGDGNPLAGQAVTFQTSPSSVAEASDVTTGADGSAETTVNGLGAGTATITAKALGGSASSNSVSLVVLAPTIAIEASPDNITASSTAGTGATITVTVTDDGGTPLSDQTVTFATTLGDLDATSRKTDADGKAQVKLTSEQPGEALVTAEVLGETSSAASVTVEAGALDTLTLTASANTIALNGSATISIQAEDEFGNPVDETVALTSTLGATATVTGNLSPTSVDLIDGSGQATFTPTEQGVARIRASVGGSQLAFVDVSVEIQLAGEPAQIRFTIPEEEREITVTGSGGTEAATIEVEVVDVNGAPITDVASNLELEIIRGAGGGESLDGIAGLGQTRTLSTSGGKATATLESGTRPGTVLIEVRVVKDSLGNDLDPPLTATVPQITIRSGPPASLFLTASNAIASPGLAGNGSITHDYLAFVSDLWGNAVPDDTIVFFSQFLNIVRECRNRLVFDPNDPSAVNGFVEETCAGADAGSITPSADPDSDPRATFTSGKADFDGELPFDDVSPGDTLVIITEDNPLGLGGYRINEVSADKLSVLLEADFDAPVSGLEWAVGNNANLGGGVFTTEGEAATAGGVARWSNTYAGELVNSPVYIFAEAEGGTQAHARFFALAWRADTEIVQLAGAENNDKVTAGAPLGFSFLFRDASTPTPYAIASLLTSVAASGGTLDFFAGDKAFQDPVTGALTIETDPRSIATGDPGGEIDFIWTPPGTAVADDEFTLFISGGGVTSKLKLIIQ